MSSKKEESYREMCKELYVLHRNMWSDLSPEMVRRGVRRKAMVSLWVDLVQGEGGLENAIKVFSPRKE